jgi:peptidyl-Lys metalloendopeptidase
LNVLKWYTPLEGIAGQIFRVERDGEVIPYEGILATRVTAPPEAYVLLEPGESVSAEVDLATAYDFSKAGEYTIEFLSPTISHIAKTEAEMAKTVDDLGPVEIPSNRVTIEIGGSSDEDEAGTSQGSATDSSTTVTISSTSGPSGTLVQVVASGFPPHTPVSMGVGPVGWQFSEVAQGTSDANGVFTVYVCGNSVCWTR